MKICKAEHCESTDEHALLEASGYCFSCAEETACLLAEVGADPSSAWKAPKKPGRSPVTKTEKRLVEAIVGRLRGRSASPEVAAALTGPCGAYLETWVIPALELLIKEDRSRSDLAHAETLVS